MLKHLGSEVLKKLNGTIKRQHAASRQACTHTHTHTRTHLLKVKVIHATGAEGSRGGEKTAGYRLDADTPASTNELNASNWM